MVDDHVKFVLEPYWSYGDRMKPYWSYGDRIKPVQPPRGVDFMCGCIWSRTVSHGFSRSCTIAYTILHGHGIRVSFFKVLKIIHGFHGYTRMARV